MMNLDNSIRSYVSLVLLLDELHEFVRKETKGWTHYGYDYINKVANTAVIVCLEELVTLDILVEVITTTFLSGVYNNSSDESQQQRVLDCILKYYPTPNDRYRVGINIKSIPNERMLISHGVFHGRDNKVFDIIIDSIVWNYLLLSNDDLINIDLGVVLHDVNLINAGWLDAVDKANRIVKTDYVKKLVGDLCARA